NEELQSINEELRSATEELETSKEELQSLNEELTTVNFELKQKVDETAKANDDLNNLVTSMNMATVFVDRQMRIKGFTPPASNVFNLLATDIGRPLHDLRHRLLTDTLASDVESVVTTLQPVEREVAAEDGRWHLMRVTVYRTTEDRIDGAVLNFIDVTDRRRAQEQLRARDERLRLVADSTRDYAVITLDSAGTITGWNTGAELMFGYDEADIQGQHFRLLFTPEDRADGIPELELRQACEQGRTLDERWHMRKDGSRFFCSGITSPLAEGDSQGFAKIARDLTERQLLEKQREELLVAEQAVRQRLEAADALRSEFLAVMSHELKNPLNLMMMNAELVGRSLEVSAQPALARAVGMIRRAVRAQAKIIDDLLDLARIDTGKLTLSRTAVPLAATVERIVGAMRSEAEAKGVAMRVEDEPLTVFGDPVRVEQIVWNLLNNALKFTPAGGSIDVRVFQDEECAAFEVRDTGCGIDPKLLPKVFEMFEQGGAGSTTRREGGLGIGLALVKSLAELHGGTVAAQSGGAGLGATFAVRLPLFEGVLGADGEPYRLHANMLAGRRILLVEDDADALQTLTAVLQTEGADITPTSGAAEALALAQGDDFDLVISDIAMPDMDGLQFIIQLRQLPHARRWPAIAVSGFGRPEDASRSLAAGFDVHLRKPLSLQDLEDALIRLGRQGAE
ncbi:MAG: ATP-binding protein, partial [Burkholderiaceae bacterium]